MLQKFFQPSHKLYPMDFEGSALYRAAQLLPLRLSPAVAAEERFSIAGPTERLDVS
jgi:hypothetical protein